MNKLKRQLIVSVSIFLSLFPIFFILVMSVSSNWSWPNIFPSDINLDSWRYVFKENPQTWSAIVKSLEIAIFTVLINLVLGVPAGDALGRYDFKFKKTIEFLLLLPIVIPSIIFSIGIHTRFIALGLSDTTLGVVICHVIITLPYMIRTVKLSFENLGFDLEDQAKMLGANKLNRIVFVVFPFILPGIIAGTVLTILISVSEYVTTALIGGGEVVTLPLVMFPFINSVDNIGAVYSIVFAVIVLLSVTSMDFFLKKYLREKR